MMKFIRWILGKVILLLDAIFRPVQPAHSPGLQARLDQATSTMSIYQFEACPFCVKVRREIRRLGLNIELRDAANDSIHSRALEKEGGSRQVPCLRYKDEADKDKWLYESSEIITFLRNLASALSA